MVDSLNRLTSGNDFISYIIVKDLRKTFPNVNSIDDIMDTSQVFLKLLKIIPIDILKFPMVIHSLE